MNRRTFLRSLLALPFAAKVALSSKQPAAWPMASTDPLVNAKAEADLAYQLRYGDLPGIHAMLKRCGDSVYPESVDLDEVFAKLYALKKRKVAVMSDDEWREGRRTIRYKYRNVT